MRRLHVLPLASSALKTRLFSFGFNDKCFRCFSSQLPLESRRLEGKVGVITGGASGIGEATAKEFVAHGAKVVIADIQEEAGKRLSRQLQPHARFLRCDVREERDVRRAVDFAVQEYGQLNIMFNNAGVAGCAAATPAEVSARDLEGVMAVNVRGVLLGVKHAARAMMAANSGGSILCTCSTASVVVLKSFPNYTISKHAVVGIVKSAAADLAAHGIRVNCVSPYGLATPIVMDQMRRLVSDVTVESVANSMEKCTDFRGVKFSVDDVAKAALFLCSDESRYISGHNLVIDGAFSSSKEFNPLKSYSQNLNA